ncbi:MAG: hypothetical protein F6K23_06535 [Okeania sp. SIO2C9]|nr:hypothetical protein [Okeania sp. SIO2C9]NEQ72757.1 hypothetical protein [Okeania sp. SIO2C9]
MGGRGKELINKSMMIDLIFDYWWQLEVLTKSEIRSHKSEVINDWLLND